MAVVEDLAVDAGVVPCSAVGKTDEPVSVLVIVTPAALVVMTVRHGTVVVLFPDIRTSPVTV